MQGLKNEKKTIVLVSCTKSTKKLDEQNVPKQSQSFRRKRQKLYQILLFIK